MPAGNLSVGETIGIVVGLSTLIGLLISIGKWASKMAETASTATSSINLLRDEIKPIADLAREGLRQAQAAHSRVDAAILSIQQLEVLQARLDERVKLKATGRFYPSPEATPDE